MGKAPKPFVFTLLPAEAAEILEAPAGEGGHQELRKRLINQLETNVSEVSLTDSELGELIRYMTQYGEGGFQGRLRRAFLRSVYELLAVKV